MVNESILSQIIVKSTIYRLLIIDGPNQLLSWAIDTYSPDRR